MEFIRTHKIAICIGVIAFVLRFFLVFGYEVWRGPEAFRTAFAPGSDSARYINLGHNLAYEGVYSPSPRPPYAPEETIEPAYPLFLAALFFLKESLLLVALCQIFLAAATTILVYKIAEMYMPRVPSIIAGLLFAAEPVGAYLAGAVFTETLFMSFFISGIYYFLKSLHVDASRSRWGIFFGGLFLGASALTRPEVQFLAVVFVLFCFWVRRGESKRNTMRALAVFLIGFFLVLAPWLVRNKITYGSWQTSSIGIHKVYLFDLLYFYSHEENVSFKEARAALRDRVVAISPYGNDDPTFANAPYLQKVAIDYIRERPISFAVFYTVKTLPFFFGDGLRYLSSKFALADAPIINISGHILEGEFGVLWRALHTEEALPVMLLLVGGFCWFVITVGMVLGIWFACRQKDPRVRGSLLLLAALILIFAFMSGPVSNPRLRFKAEPLMFILAAFGFFQLLHARLNGPRALPEIFKDDKGEEYRIAEKHP